MAIEIIQSNLLNQFPEVVHFFSTRQGGVSPAPFSSLNFGASQGDDVSNVEENKHALLNYLNINNYNILLPFQTHSCNIINTNKNKTELNCFDGLISNNLNEIIAVKTADCVPILLYDFENKSFAAVHSGWKGTVQHIVTQAVKQMRDDFGSKPEHIVAAIGPSIGPEVYEVGQNVREAFANTFEASEPFFTTKANGKFLLNLWEANKYLLLKSGLKSEHIDIIGLCTFSHPELFFSARREGIQSGRMANGIGLRK